MKTIFLHIFRAGKKLSLFCCVFFFAKRAAAQINYQDSCVSVEFYFQAANKQLDTMKVLKTKHDKRTLESILFDERSLNLVVLFRNLCDQKIAVPSIVTFGNDFWIEGFRIDSGRHDTLRVNLAVDYLHGETGKKDIAVAARKTFLIPYGFPLGLKIDAKGLYKFRLQFFNSSNYIPFDDWKTYYSNWVYLKIE